MEKPVKRKRAIKNLAGILIGLILISLTLTAVVGCGSSGGGTSGTIDSGSNDSGSDDSGDDDAVSIASGYAIVDTGQTACYDDSDELVNYPAHGEVFYGQDAQYDGSQPSYTDNGDGTVTDNVTGLMWQQRPDTDGDGDIDAADKLTYTEAVAGAIAITLGGNSDWRLPTIKELYSLSDFSGVDPSGYEGDDTAGLVPFIDTTYFDFAYGDTSAGERIIDSQYASSNLYVDERAGGLLFGVNFADGRIKGYGLTLFGFDKTFFVIYVRGNTDYGENDFADNGDGTIIDIATGLMWAQDDSGSDSPDGLDWEEALAWVKEKNAEKNDKCLPHIYMQQIKDSWLVFQREIKSCYSCDIGDIKHHRAYDDSCNFLFYPHTEGPYGRCNHHDDFNAFASLCYLYGKTS